MRIAEAAAVALALGSGLGAPAAAAFAPPSSPHGAEVPPPSGTAPAPRGGNARRALVAAAGGGGLTASPLPFFGTGAEAGPSPSPSASFRAAPLFLASDAAAVADAASPAASASAGADADADAELDVPALTAVFLDASSHPPGSLLPSHLDAALPLCLRWARESASSSAPSSSARGADDDDEEWGHPAEIVERIVARLEEERAAGCEKALPWRNLYAVAIDAWAKSGRRDAADRARAVLDSLIPPAQKLDDIDDDGTDKGKGEGEDEIEAEGAGAGGGTPAAKASLAGGRNPWASPNTVMHNAVLNAYAKASAMGNRNAARRAEGLLRNMEKIWEGRREAMATATVAAAAMAAAGAEAEEAAAGAKPAEEAARGADAAAAIAAAAAAPTVVPEDRSVIPNTISYTSVIDAYAQSDRPDAASDAERVFRRMERASSTEGGNVAARPNARSFNAVLNAWARTGTGRGAARAEEILRRMVELGCDDVNGCEEGGVEPTVVSFTTVVNGWAKSDESGAADRALSVFNLMSDLHKSGRCRARPNSFTYSALINALCRGGRAEEAAEVWEEVCDSFEEAMKEGAAGREGAKERGKPAAAALAPDAVQLTRILTALSKGGDPKAGVRAEALLGRLEGLSSRYGPPLVPGPNAATYAGAINCHAKSRTFGKARAARCVLDRMRDAHASALAQNKQAEAADVRPNVAAYTSVLNACAFAVGDATEKGEALRIAASTYGELCNDPRGYGVRPNQYAYGTMLRACSNLIPPGSREGGGGRAASVASVFRRCRDEGYVDVTVMRALRGAGLTEEELGEALGGPDAAEAAAAAMAGDVPEEWSRNVSRGRRAFGNRSRRGGQRRGGRRAPKSSRR